jgi:hypothetical protein
MGNLELHPYHSFDWHHCHIQGGEPKLVWPKDAPCTKIYTNGGKHAVKGPGPEHFQILMSELFQTEVGYHTWMSKLATCQQSVGVNWMWWAW